ncbi:hypothetical protein [Williamsoniiplasma lucivorax]|uniref:Uncharacterized protein n=1 Tax=Williamsoniiplasma lucivorax TaxID=209274 RepID=A0A2S5RDL4_9MOLU|nr:hypothetical protein [Williamsoniiplasma lucivorax]PPE05388.1 hypothetical protein ELUCI_v1c04800 [Williamsoniiplasma lucivorax]
MKKYGRLIVSDNGLRARDNGATIKSAISKTWFVNELNIWKDEQIEEIQNIDDENENEISKWLNKVNEIYDLSSKLNVKQIKELADISWSGEWHHSGKYAAEVKYFWFNDMIREIKTDLDFWKEKSQEKILPMNELTSQKVNGTFAVWGGSKRQAKIEYWVDFKNCEKVGNWIYTPLGKKSANGKWIEWEHANDSIQIEFENKTELEME